MKAKKIPRLQLVRRIVLGTLLAAVTFLTIGHQLIPQFPSIDSLCPFGGIETAYKYLAGGELIKKIMPSNIVLLVAIVVLAIVLSRFFCGWLCAFGALQGLFGWLGKKIFKRSFVVPPKVDRYLRLIKYPLLVVIIYFTWRTGTLVIRPYDPFAAYGHLSAGLASVWAEFAVGFVILVATLVFSMLYERAFCKYLCPLGAFNSLLARIPLFRIKRNANTCISCSRCDKVCPMNVDVSTPGQVDSLECIGCMECVTACPTKKPSLSTALAGKTVKPALIAVLGIAIYFGAMGVGKLFDMLNFSGPSLAELSVQGALKVEDIKGSSTWAQVAEAYGVDLQRLYKEAGVDPAKVPPETQLKGTGALTGSEFEADTARVAVAKILGIPYTGENGDLTPAAEAGPSSSEPQPAVAQPSPSAPAVSAPASSAAAKTVTPAASPSTQVAAPQQAGLTVPADFALEGTMTIADVAKALGASETAVLAKLQLPKDFPLDKPLRDLKDQYGYTLPTLKERFAK